MKSFIYKNGPGLQIEINCADEDYDWMREIFLRNEDPFKALCNLGYIEKEEYLKSFVATSKVGGG